MKTNRLASEDRPFNPHKPNIDALVSDTHTLKIQYEYTEKQCVGAAIEGMDICYMAATFQILTLTHFYLLLYKIFYNSPNVLSNKISASIVSDQNSQFLDFSEIKIFSNEFVFGQPS